MRIALLTAADDEALDPAAGARALDVEVESVAVRVASDGRGADEGGGEAVVGVSAPGLGAAGFRGPQLHMIHSLVIYAMRADMMRRDDFARSDETSTNALKNKALRDTCGREWMRVDRGMVLLCRRHHRAVHEEGFRVGFDAAGEPRFVRPDGQALPEAPPPPAVTGPPLASVWARLDREGVRLDPHTATPAWRGEQLDLDWAVGVLWRPRGGTPPAGPAA